jgi:hypothetical protein
MLMQLDFFGRERWPLMPIFIVNGRALRFREFEISRAVHEEWLSAIEVRYHGLPDVRISAVLRGGKRLGPLAIERPVKTVRPSGRLVYQVQTVNGKYRPRC